MVLPRTTEKDGYVPSWERPEGSWSFNLLHVNGRIMLLWYFFLYSVLTPTTCYDSPRVGRQNRTIWCTTLFPECALKVYVEWFGGCGGGKGRHMNHSLNAGNKVHFLSRQTISLPLWDTAGPPDINLHGGILFLPRGAETGCFDLNGSIYHTCSSILKDDRVRKRRGEGGRKQNWHVWLVNGSVNLELLNTLFGLFVTFYTNVVPADFAPQLCL